MIRYFVFAAVILCSLYMLVPWEWAMMDDPNFVTQLKAMTDLHGVVAGVFQNIINLYNGDFSWGLFRPSWWVYASTFYLLPSRAAHFVRFWMIASTVLIPLYAIARRRMSLGLPPAKLSLFVFSAGLLLSNRALYEGFSYPSLQEVGGTLSIAIGVLLAASSERVRPAAIAMVLFVIATWFKAPFAWFPFAFSAGLYFFEPSKKTVGIVGFFATLSNLVVIGYWAKHGSYTARFNPLNLDAIIGTLKNFMIPGSYAFVIIAIAVLTLRPQFPSLNSLKSIWLECALIASSCIYLDNLMPWKAFGYYFSAPVFLFSLGATLFAARVPSGEMPKLATVIAIAVACFVAFKGMSKAYYRDQGIRIARDYAIGLPFKGLTFATNGLEYSDRFKQLMKLRTGGEWSNDVVFVDDTHTPPRKLDYYIITFEDTYDANACEQVVSSYKLGKICRAR